MPALWNHSSLGEKIKDHSWAFDGFRSIICVLTATPELPGDTVNGHNYIIAGNFKDLEKMV